MCAVWSPRRGSSCWRPVAMECCRATPSIDWWGVPGMRPGSPHPGMPSMRRSEFRSGPSPRTTTSWRAGHRPRARRPPMRETSFRCTAIVPTLDRPADLEVCLRSLRAAEPGFEAVVVVDQGVPGKLAPMVESLGARYLHLDRRGLSRARNLAIAVAGTPWLSFPDDDCRV